MFLQKYGALHRILHAAIIIYQHVCYVVTVVDVFSYNHLLYAFHSIYYVLQQYSCLCMARCDLSPLNLM